MTNIERIASSEADRYAEENCQAMMQDERLMAWYEVYCRVLSALRFYQSAIGHFSYEDVTNVSSN